MAGAAGNPWWTGGFARVSGGLCDLVETCHKIIKISSRCHQDVIKICQDPKAKDLEKDGQDNKKNTKYKNISVTQ